MSEPGEARFFDCWVSFCGSLADTSVSTVVRSAGLEDTFVGLESASVGLESASVGLESTSVGLEQVCSTRYGMSCRAMSRCALCSHERA